MPAVLTPDRRPWRLWLALLVSGALVLRVILVLRGGQLVFPDELRYVQTRAALGELLAGDPRPLAWLFVTRADPPLFKGIALLPAALEHVLGPNLRIPGLFFGAFSVVNIWLLWRVARRAGASEQEAWLAAVLLALSNGMFYYARHLLPYDVALTLALTALLIALHSPATRRGALACGLLAGLTTLAYGGYWLLAGWACVTCVLMRPAPWRRRAETGVLCGLGWAAPPTALLLVSAAVGGTLWQVATRFTSHVTQGDFREGWRLPWEYLWHAEHGLLAVWLLATAVAIRHWRAGPTRVRLWLGALAWLYGGMVLCSVGLHKFVVYGRIARAMIPLFGLLTAFGLDRMLAWRHWPRVLTTTGIAALVVQAGWNFSGPLRQVFPREFVRAVEREFPDLTIDMDAAAFRPGQCEACGEYRLVYAKHLWPAPETIRLPAHDVLREAPHPLQFLPYQYEGFDPTQRDLLRRADIRMRLVRLRAQAYVERP